MPTDTEIAIINWLANGETCASSKTLAFWAAFDIKTEEHGYPREPADIRRCLKLLHVAPSLRAHIHKMASTSGLWAQVVDNWDQLEKTLLEEVDHLDSDMHLTPKSDNLLKDVLCGTHRKKGAAK